MTAYRIKDWDINYEKRHTASEVVFHWIALPTKHDGKGFRRLSQHPKAVSVFCAWVLIAEVAAKQPVRGTLIDKDGPLTARDLADKTGFPSGIFDTALAVLSDPEVGIDWIEEVPSEEVSRQVATCRDKSLKRTGQESRGEEKNPASQGSAEPASAASAVATRNGQSVPESDREGTVVLTFPTVAGRRGKADAWDLRAGYVSELNEAFPGVDVLVECRKALAWIRAKPANRKTAGGMREFLLRWMARVQNRGLPGKGANGRASTREEWASKSYSPG